MLQDVIASLSLERLLAAAESLYYAENVRSGDSDSSTCDLGCGGSGSKFFCRKSEMRLHIRALFVEFGLPAFWLTVNPSDLR